MKSRHVEQHNWSKKKINKRKYPRFDHIPNGLELLLILLVLAQTIYCYSVLNTPAGSVIQGSFYETHRW
jgi:hypothetical protein